MTASHKYRAWLREGIRPFLTPELEALLMGEKVSYMRMCDLEALFELIFGFNPRARAPAGYRPRQG